MPERDKPISSANPPESKGERRDLDPSQDLYDLSDEAELNGAGLQAHRQEAENAEPAVPVTPEEEAKESEKRRKHEEAMRLQREQQAPPAGSGEPADSNVPTEQKLGDDVTGPPMRQEVEATKPAARRTTRKAPASNATQGDL